MYPRGRKVTTRDWMNRVSERVVPDITSSMSVSERERREEKFYKENTDDTYQQDIQWEF